MTNTTHFNAEKEEQVTNLYAVYKLLEKLKADTKMNVVKRAVITKKAEAEQAFYEATYSKEVISYAKARLRGEVPPVRELKDLATMSHNQDDVATEWAKVVAQFKDTNTEWATKAYERDLEIRTGIDNYIADMQPLYRAIEGAQGSNVPGVKSGATKALERLQEAEQSLKTLSARAVKATKELENFQSLAVHLMGDRPQTLDEVRGFPAEFTKSLQACRNADADLQKQIAVVDATCKKCQKGIEEAINTMVRAAIAWQDSKDVNATIKAIESVANCAVTLVQKFDGEPLSHTALAGVHTLIKGISSIARGATIAIMSTKTADQDVLETLKGLEPDSFVQMKVDLLEEGLTWLAEPIGYAPAVGAHLREAIVAVVEMAADVVREVVEEQVEAFKTKKAVARGVVAAGQAKVESKLVEGFTEQLSTGAKLFGAVVEAADDVSKIDGLIAELLKQLCGPALKKLVAKVMGDLQFADKDQIRESVQGARNAIDDLAKKQLNVQSVKLDYAFDEDAAKTLNVSLLATLRRAQRGEQIAFYVAASDVFKTTRGVALLLGDDHSDDNKQVVLDMMRQNRGYRGTMTRASSSKELHVNCDPQAKDWVKDYFKHYSSELDVKLTFARG